MRLSRSTCAAAVLLVVVAGLLAAAPVSEAQAGPSACAGVIPTAGYSASSNCSFVADGSELQIGGSTLATVQITYSLLTPVLPGWAGVAVELTTPDGMVVASCGHGFLIAAACRATAPPVPAGTTLTCTAHASAFAGAAWYACGPGAPRSS